MARRAFVILIAVAAVGAAARGDELVIGRTPYLQCIISGVEDGKVLFRHSRTGRTIRKPITDVKSIRLTGEDLFNEAETLRKAGKPAQAARAFEQLAQRVRRGWKNRLIRYRLLEALGEAGQSGRWVTEWAKIVAESERKSLVLAYRPKRLAPKGSASNARAITALERLRKKTRRKTELKEIKGLLLDLYEREDRKEAAALAEELLGGKKTAKTAGTDEPDDLPQVIEAKLRGAAFVLRKDPAKALDVIEGVLRHCGPGELPLALLLRGKAQLGLAAKAAKKERRRRLVKAGLDFMRVYAHFPGSEEAPEALYEAGKVNTILPRPDLVAARAAYQRVIGRFPDNPFAKAARDSLAKLGR